MERVQTHKPYALITGLVIIVMSAAFYIAGFEAKGWVQWLIYVPFLIGLILNAQAYSKANGGYITFGQAFSSCFKATALITILVLSWTILSTYIFPEMKDRAFESAQAEMESQGSSEEQIEMALNLTRRFFIPFLIMGVVLGYMFVGAIFSLIAAAIARKRDGMRPPMDVMSQTSA